MRTRTRSRHLAVALTTGFVVLVGLLTACGDESGGDPESTPTPTPTGSPGTPTPSPSPPGSPTPPGASPPVIVPPPPSSDRPGLTTLTGQVFAGVEAGCVLLSTSSGDYLLIGEAASQISMGDNVTVRGQVRADLATTCQQGTPFEVSEVVD